MRRLVACSALLLLAACGGKPATLDQARLEGQIHTWAVKQGANTSVKVDCPDDVPAKPGHVFHCLVRGGAQSIRLTVTVENDKGYVTWVQG